MLQPKNPPKYVANDRVTVRGGGRSEPFPPLQLRGKHGSVFLHDSYFAAGANAGLDSNLPVQVIHRYQIAIDANGGDLTTHLINEDWLDPERR